jgi:hypothetical protein
MAVPRQIPWRRFDGFVGAPTAAGDASNALNAAVAMQRRVLSINLELHNEHTRNQRRHGFALVKLLSVTSDLNVALSTAIGTL